MTGLGEILARLGLSQYLGRLIDEGFEKWETVLDITEQDLYASSVPLCVVLLTFPLKSSIEFQIRAPAGMFYVLNFLRNIQSTPNVC